MRVNVSGCVWVAFVCCCFACDCVLELVVCRVRFARVSCPWLRFEVYGAQVKEEIRGVRMVCSLGRSSSVNGILWMDTRFV